MELLLQVAEDALRRSALRAPRSMLERVLALSAELDQSGKRDLIQLRTISLLGPLVTLLDGHRSASALYETGKELYFAVHASERAPFFPVLWGWWFTAGDLIEQTRRSEILIRDVTPDADRESRLQALHCGWATLFDGGAHDRCLTAITDGLSLYDTETAQRSRYKYGHDARVCGLGERTLSAWLTGQLDLSAQSIQACEEWADETGHLPSRLHALDIAMQVAFFNRDPSGIDRVLSKIESISQADAVPVIAAKRQIFRSWARVRNGGDADIEAVEQGLHALHGFGVLEDTPFYADIAAEVRAHGGASSRAVGRLEDDIADAKATGLTFWLPELLRRKAVLTNGAAAEAALDEGFQIAQAQNAQMLALRNLSARIDLGLAIPSDQVATMAEKIGHVSDCRLRRQVANALGI
ncbi:hypothetical protein [Ruegeria sp. HKCCD8929]|uniref:hypothetical protein n=1 Tax=Ruegeria sp. HKCCD8929 TaxID=2683006 RepID=UPI001489B3BF|nr:hypothetical protein [Ruegeria sp. HKCCD8929]